MRKTTWRFDRRWGAMCPPTFVFIMVLALATTAFAAPTANTDDPTNSANPAQEVTATLAMDDATMATPVATNNVVVTTPATVAPSLGADVPDQANYNPANMTTAPDDTGGHNEANLFMWTDSAAGLLFTEFTTANMGGSTDAGVATSAEASGHAGMPNPHRTTEGAFRGAAPMTSLGNNADANSFGNADPP